MIGVAIGLVRFQEQAGGPDIIAQCIVNQSHTAQSPGLDRFVGAVGVFGKQSQCMPRTIGQQGNKARVGRRNRSRRQPTHQSQQTNDENREAFGHLDNLPVH